jgi:hypothetical protein
MDVAFSTDQSEITTSAPTAWKLDDMVDQVRRSLHREVDPGMIRQTLIEILSGYGDARIQTFIPILACRKAKEILQEKQSVYQEQ